MTCQAGLIEMARPDRRVTHGKRARRHESRVNNQPALTPFGRPDTLLGDEVHDVRREVGSTVLIAVREPWLIEQKGRILRWVKVLDSRRTPFRQSQSNRPATTH